MIRRAIALAALLFIEAGADAQPQQPITASVAPPAERLAITGGGVDIRTGRFAYTATDLSIGEDDESGGLALTRTLLTDVGLPNPFANFSHNWHIMAIERRVDIARLDFTSGAGPDYRIMVRFGGRSETLDALAGSGYGQTSNDSLATLTFTGSKPSAGVIYTFQSADGTIATFRPLGGNDCGIRCAFVSEIVQPDGTRSCSLGSTLFFKLIPSEVKKRDSMPVSARTTRSASSLAASAASVMSGSAAIAVSSQARCGFTLDGR